MANLTLTLSCGDYDRTRPLIEGRVNTQGLDLTVIPLPSAERHSRFVKNLEFDVCELQVAQYLGLKSRGAPITALPVFPHRRFNHSCVLIRRDSDIQRPEELSGRRIGIQGHFNPIALWMRGVLQHEHGIDLTTIRWVTKGAENIPGWSPVENIADRPYLRRLWPNYREVEADYYRRAGIFPIHHMLVVKDEVLQKTAVDELREL